MVTKKQETILNRILYNHKDAIQFIHDGQHIFTDGYRIVRLNDVLPEQNYCNSEEVLKKNKDKIIDNFDKEKKIGNFESKESVDTVMIPTIQNIKAFIKENNYTRWNSKPIKLTIVANEKEIYFNPFYLIDCLEVLKIGKEPTTAVVHGSLKPMYFKSTIGEAILCPCRVKDSWNW